MNESAIQWTNLTWNPTTGCTHVSDGCNNTGFEGPSPLQWVIAGGESGPNHRPFDPQWARDIRDQCLAAGVPFFFEQHGGHTPKASGRLLDGREWNEFPEGASRC